MAGIKTLYDEEGSAEGVLRRLGNSFHDEEQRAREEAEWCHRNAVEVVTIADDRYPHRLRQCGDAPMALFVRGNADLNARRILSIVGTRKVTAYGMDAVDAIVRGLQRQCPDIMIVSGLAYGVDINAHRAALKNGLPTVGVVAHGQDTLYPSHHRNEANQMCLNGGAVVTEFPHGTRPLAPYFLQRNRIIAGMADATLVVESAQRGGGLATARLAQEYDREVFAVPGSINAEMSAGTNALIRDNRAALVTSADDILHAMMWQPATRKAEAIQRNLFPELTPEEQLIVETLAKEDLHANILSNTLHIPIGQLTATVFALEMKGIIKQLPGNIFHLIPFEN